MNDQLTLDDYRLSRRVSTTEHEETIEARFWRFHADHPNVYALLVRFAREAHGAGVRKIGMKMLWERARWSVAVEGLPDARDQFKLNNDFTSRYARLLMEREPDLAGLFETRELRA